MPESCGREMRTPHALAKNVITRTDPCDARAWCLLPQNTTHALRCTDAELSLPSRTLAGWYAPGPGLPFILAMPWRFAVPKPNLTRGGLRACLEGTERRAQGFTLSVENLDELGSLGPSNAL